MKVKRDVWEEGPLCFTTLKTTGNYIILIFSLLLQNLGSGKGELHIKRAELCIFYCDKQKLQTLNIPVIL